MAGRRGEGVGPYAKSHLDEYRRSGREGKKDKPSKSNRRAGITASRARIASGAPQAVLKVTSWGKGAKNVRARIEYAAKEKDNSVERSDGSIIKDKEEINALVEEWSADFSNRKNGKDTAQMILSFPAGVDKKAADRAAREFLKETFGETNDYVFASHDDTKNYHHHVIINAANFNGKRLRIDKAVLRDMREAYAQKLRGQSILVDASPRYMRGVGQKSSNQSLYEIRKRETYTKRDREAIAKIVSSRGDRWGREVSDKQMQRWMRERLEYARTAHSFAKALQKTNISDRPGAIKLIADLSIYSIEMQKPKLRHDGLRRKVDRTATKRQYDPIRVGESKIAKLIKETHKILDEGGLASQNSQKEALLARARIRESAKKAKIASFDISQTITR